MTTPPTPQGEIRQQITALYAKHIGVSEVIMTTPEAQAEINDWCRLFAEQLDKLLEQKQTYTIGEDDSSEEYNYTAVPVEAILKLKGELEL